MALERESRNDMAARQRRIQMYGFHKPDNFGRDGTLFLQVPDGHVAIIHHADDTHEEFGPHDPQTNGHTIPAGSRIKEIKKI